MLNSFQTLKRTVLCESILVTLGDWRGNLGDTVWLLVCEMFLDTHMV